MGAERNRHTLLTRLLAAALAFLVAALPVAAQPAGEPGVRVIVLPFQVHSARQLDYLEASLADLLTTRLEATGAVDVLERDAATDPYRTATGSEPGLRAIALERGARFVITGSLTELAGQYSLDLRVAPAAGGAAATLDAAASGDDQLLDRIGDLAVQIAEVVGGRGARPRVTSLKIEGVPDEAAAKAMIETQLGEPFDGDVARADAERLGQQPGFATATVESSQGESGIDVVFRVVASARITTAVNAQLSSARLARDVREIYALGFFKNVRVLQDEVAGGVAITFAVEENPIVRQVSVTGNDEVESDKIKDNLTLTTGSTLDYPLLTENVQRI